MIRHKYAKNEPCNTHIGSFFADKTGLLNPQPSREIQMELLKLPSFESVKVEKPRSKRTEPPEIVPNPAHMPRHGAPKPERQKSEKTEPVVIGPNLSHMPKRGRKKKEVIHG